MNDDVLAREAFTSAAFLCRHKTITGVFHSCLKGDVNKAFNVGLCFCSILCQNRLLATVSFYGDLTLFPHKIQEALCAVRLGFRKKSNISPAAMVGSKEEEVFIV